MNGSIIVNLLLENFLLNKSRNILFDKRTLRKLLKDGYEFVTFDVFVIAWKKQPYFVPGENCKLSPEQNRQNGLWINASPSAGYLKISQIMVQEPWIHTYSIEKLLEIVPNSEQQE